MQRHFHIFVNFVFDNFSYTNHFKNCKAMNEEHFRFYWLYILDLKNLLIEKQLGQVFWCVCVCVTHSLNFKVANPTCPERQTVILESLTVKSNIVEKDEGLESDMESVIAAMESTNLASEVFCKCTRKCATMTCPCKKSLKLCDLKCHAKNLKCQNK